MEAVDAPRTNAKEQGVSSRPRFATVPEVAEWIGLPTSTVYGYVRDAKLPGAFRCGRHWRINLEVLEEWFNAQVEAPAQERSKQ